MWFLKSVVAPLFVLSLLPRDVEARTWHVRPDGTGDVATIQAAIDTSQLGDEILLAPGRYTSLVRLAPDVRIRSEAGAANTVIDGARRGATLVSGSDIGSVHIEGVTLTGGHPALAVRGNSALRMVNCVIRDNFSYVNEAVSCVGATFVNCEFLNNTSEGTTGAVRARNGAFSGCVFRGNAVVGHTSGSGGAILMIGSTVTDCWFEGNFARGVHGRGYGGAIYVTGAEPSSIVRSTFIANYVPLRGSGGALELRAPSTISECVFVGNSAGIGGAVASNTPDVFIAKSTFVGNQALDEGSAVVHLAGGVVKKSIFAWNDGPACTPSTTNTCCLFWSNSPSDSLCAAGSESSFVADPDFCAEDPAVATHFFVARDSPCLPGNHPAGAECGRIGAVAVGCDAVTTRAYTWSAFKRLYR